MQIASATIYALNIPFVEKFAHSSQTREASDAIVVQVCDTNGTQGFGEGLARPYVTGETSQIAIEHLRNVLLPAIMGRELPLDLASLDSELPNSSDSAIVAHHASRSALSLALVDCSLRSHKASSASLLPPCRKKVMYSGVITAGSVEKAVQQARQLRVAGISSLKIKVGGDNDVARLAAIRAAVGSDVSLRLDANAAWNLGKAKEVLQEMEPFGIASVEQPLPRSTPQDWSALRSSCSIPLMADESVVTAADLESLVAAKAIDLVNIRISKCGGLWRSLQLIKRAEAAGIGIQIGCQVGETAILSAAGRALAASVADLRFAEGSFGTLLLSQDIARHSVRFGFGGWASALSGLGFGIDVLPERLSQLSVQTWNVGDPYVA